MKRNYLRIGDNIFIVQNIVNMRLESDCVFIHLINGNSIRFRYKDAQEALSIMQRIEDQLNWEDK